MRGPLYRSGDQLREEHDIERIYEVVTLGHKTTFIDHNHIAQALKYMEREPEGQSDGKEQGIVVPIEKVRECRHIDVEKIEVLEEKEYSEICGDTSPQKQQSLSPRVLHY